MSLAPNISLLFSRGLFKASAITRLARSSPEAFAAPIIAIPLSVITVLTSAKSTFIYPGNVIISAIPLAAIFNTSLALANALDNVCDPNIRCIFSLSMIIKESTCSFNLFTPSRAWSNRFGPSKREGIVTIPTVRIPISLAILAITGAAPVPVPPPIAAVINTIFVLVLNNAFISSILSLAAASPISGRFPAPRPSVRVFPN